MSTSPSPQRPEGGTSRFKFRNPTRAFTMSAPRPASPSTTTGNGRVTPTRSSTRDSSAPPPTTRSRSSILPSALQRRVSSALAPSSTKASSSKAPSSDAVNEFGAKATEPSIATEQAPTEPPKDDAPKDTPSEDISGHARALSGSTVETEPPRTPPPTQTEEPMSVSKPEELVSDSPHDGASITSSRTPSRLRRQASNLSRKSFSGSIRRVTLLGPSSPPSVETAPVHAQGETSLSKSPSLSSLRRHAASPEPAKVLDTSTPEPTSEAEAPAAPQPFSEPATQPSSDFEIIQPEVTEPEVVQSEVVQPEVTEPETTETVVPQTEVPQTIAEAPKAEALAEVQPEMQPAAISTPKESTPAHSVKAPSTTEAPAPKPVEPQTPVKPLMSRSTSRASLTKSPTPEKPEPKRRGTLANWARKSLDRRGSISNSPAQSSSALERPSSRGPVDDDSDSGSVRERERKWGTGLPVPNPPTPKKSEDNLKRRFSLGRRVSESKSPNDSNSDAEKKSNWGSRMARVVSKVKKEKEKADGSSITPDASSLDLAPPAAPPAPAPAPAAPAPEPESRPALMIPDRMFADQRPLSAIVESPAVPLNPHMLAGFAQSPAQVMGAPAPTDSPVVVKAETTSPEMSPVMVTLDSETSGVDSGAENPPALAAVAAEMQPEPELTVVEEPATIPEVEEPEEEVPAPVEVVQETPAVVEPVQETPAVVEEIAAPETRPSTPPVVEPYVVEPAPVVEAAPAVEAAATSAPPESLTNPVTSPNTEREIARARSPRQSNGGPSTSAYRGGASPAPSIIGVKRKHADEPAEVGVGKARVRYLPGESDSEPEPKAVSLNVDGHVDWAVSPAIQLAVTLSLVLPRRKRDVANPANRKRGGWWPLRRGPRTEMRYNAIRGVNEEVPLASKSWVVPAAVRTTAKVVTAPARWMFRFFVPRSTRG